MASSARLTQTILEGRCGTVECVVLASGRCPACEFLDNECEQIREKGKNEPRSTARARFLAQFHQMAEYGRDGLTAARFKKEMDAFYAFRCEVKNLQIRFPCFQDGNRWILTHGFIKPGAKKKLGQWPDSEIKRAKEIRAEYFRRKQQGHRP